MLATNCSLWTVSRLIIRASVLQRSHQMLSEVLRAGRASTAGLSPLSTPDSILMCNPKLWIISRLLSESRLGEPWGRRKGHRVADAVIKAHPSPFHTHG